MKKLSIALLFSMSIMGLAIAASHTTKDTMTSSKPISHQKSTFGEGMPSADWQGKQWDKNQWDAMTPSEKDEYKTKHDQWWNSMTPAEKDDMREKHKGEKNYMDEKWDQPTDVHDPQDVKETNKFPK